MAHLTTRSAVRAIDGITTLDELARHLADAARIELSTIPPYLYAAYSLKTSGYSQWAQGASAQRTLIGIAIEEMLHMALVRNVMTATKCDVVDGKEFRFYDQGTIPTYPGDMLHRVPPLTLETQRISTTAVEGFMEVELPESRQSQVSKPSDEYHTLGELYDAIGKGIVALSDQIAWGPENTRWRQQYQRGYWNQWGGPPKPLPVVDQGSALDALHIIVEQGEGAPDEQEDSHYQKFTRIRDHVDGIGVVYDDSGKQKYTIDSGDEAVWPVVKNPKATSFTGPVQTLAQLSDAAYCYVLALLDKLYRTPADDPADRTPGQSSVRYGLERGFVAAMQGVLSPVAGLLVATPVGDGKNAGPTFGYYDLGSNPRQTLLDLCAEPALMKAFPQLGGGDGVLHQISLLPDFTI
ncbi:ferritin-like protein [Streptomyces sp. UNOB3_S3]|uniref:ferritin-like domain-containing protein n=1 Tax=Streptomyces sp. UNOB3_S3 TaxID=2871682 RepID=UPI001E641454|nr:ferritin-like protein [Streptomyces sp. UNOB3_S3]MCC3775948.1 ferritin-like protein [Streptomyces sp. UNOB3_S3]